VQPSCRQSAVAPANSCPVQCAEDQYLEVFVGCLRSAFFDGVDVASEIELQKIKPAPVELGNCPSQWVLSGLVQRAHARLAADPPFEIE